MSVKSKRLVAILAVGIVLVGAALFYLFVRFVHPVGHGPAGPTVPHDLFSKPWTDRPVLLVGIGDSVTAGFGARKGYAYFDRLVTNPPDEFTDMNGICLSAVMPKLQFTNLAISGSTSLEQWKGNCLVWQQPTPMLLGIVVLTTGGNDLIHNYGRTPPRDQAMYGASLEQAKPWIENFDRRLDSMVKKSRRDFRVVAGFFWRISMIRPMVQATSNTPAFPTGRMA